MFKVSTVLLGTTVLAACVPTASQYQPHPARAVGVAVGYVAISPVLILAGLLEGIATLPYFLEGDIHHMNRTMEASKSSVTFDQTYRYAYNRKLDSVPASGNTGQIFQNMRDATRHFQAVLTGYGVVNPQKYVLTAVRSADHDGYTLYALIHRPAHSITVKDRSGRMRILTARDNEFYRPYEFDARGRPLDVVLDWAGVPRTSIRTQKGQAILMTLGANSVLINRRSNDYWNVERRWRNGQYRQVVTERKRVIDQRLG
ncbi:MAG: hypothetical protein GY947_04080 [Rhodobacteraceae bacterium]|nr:hypothetical protein [Paracoccaceae bacterium]